MRYVLTLLLLLLADPSHAERVFDLVADGKTGDAILEARARKDPLLNDFAQWAYLRDPKTSTPIAFEEGYAFLMSRAGWPDEKLIRLRTEEAAFDNGTNHNALRQFCARFPPISGRGKIRCAEVAGVTAEQRQVTIREGWRDGDFSESEEERILNAYKKLLSGDDHRARMERLLFEEKTKAARRILPLLPRDRTTLYLARIALTENARDASARLNAVPVNFQRDPGLLFARMHWRASRNDWDGVRDLLLLAPKDPPFAELWWKERVRAVRAAMADNHYKEAVTLLAHRGTLEGEALAEALFLKGWIALTYLHDPRSAYRDFYALYNAVTTPVSKARAAYWAAQSARRNGNDAIATQWLEKAAARPLAFYGQLAYAALHPNTPLSLPSVPEATKAEEETFAKEPLVQLIRRFGQANEMALADRFLMHLARETESQNKLVLISRLAQEVAGTSGGVRAAKQALRKEVALVDAGWPLIKLPSDLPIEPALALAITRQESEFDADAQSPANAQGMMQLLPSTARDVARDHDLSYHPSDLLNPQKNITLGTRYLAGLIEARDGSYVQAIAAYNAGPGNVADWRASFGEPGTSVDAAVQWIESIPFAETRNYVMRVLENVQIYRERLTPGTALRIREDLLRGHSPPMQEAPTKAP